MKARGEMMRFNRYLLVDPLKVRTQQKLFPARASPWYVSITNLFRTSLSDTEAVIVPDVVARYCQASII